MSDQPPNQDERALRMLRRLVTVLTLVLIGGIITVTVLLAIRLNTPVVRTTPAPIPDVLALPEGTEVVVTQRMADNITVLAGDGTLFVLNPEGTQVLYMITKDMVPLLNLDGAE